MRLNLQQVLIAFLVIALVAMRFLLIDSANFAPIAAAGIFAIYYFKNKKIGFVLPIVALFISDLILQFQTGNGLYFARAIDYLGLFAAIAIAFGLFQQSKSVGNILGATVLGSLAFFVISNFGVWATGTMYPHTFGGLITAFEMGIPFYRSTFAGDLFFTGVFFGTFELLKAFLPQLRTA